MQKLKLGVKGVKDILTRDEMRKIGGGSGSGSAEACNCNTSATCTTSGESCMAWCEGGNGYYGHCAPNS